MRLFPARLSVRARIACLCALLVYSLLGAATASAQAQVPPTRFYSAQYLADPATEPPEDSAAWRSIGLPSRRGISTPDVALPGWYRITFNVPSDAAGDWAMHIRELMPAAEIWLNGRSVTYLSTPLEPETALRAYFVSFKPEWLNPGSNEVHIRIPPAGDTRSVLSTVLIGPLAPVLQESDARHFWEATLRHVVVAGATLLGCMLILFWWLRRKEPLYALFGLVALGWAVLTIGYFMSVAPIPQPWFGLLTTMADYWSEVALLLFVLHFTGCYSRRAGAIALGYGVLSTVLTVVGIFTADDWWWNWYSQPWEYSTYLTTAGSLALLIRHAWRVRAFENLAMAGAFALLTSSYVVDHVQGDLGNLEWVSVTPAAYGIVLIVFGIVLARRFASALATVESLNAGLEQRIAAREAELAANFRALADAQRRESVLNERNRIMRDMHDGIGAQLMISMQSLERGAVSTEEAVSVLRDCVEELRITIDSLDIEDNDLGALLGTVRYRLSNKLNLAGIAIEWEVGDIPPLRALDEDGALHAMRFVQEALNNVLKHSGADRIHVLAEWNETTRRAVVEISDNGRGFDVAAKTGQRGHRGLDNLRHRAERLGAHLSIESGPTGTRVRIEIPQRLAARV